MPSSPGLKNIFKRLSQVAVTGVGISDSHDYFYHKTVSFTCGTADPPPRLDPSVLFSHTLFRGDVL